MFKKAVIMLIGLGLLSATVMGCRSVEKEGGSPAAGTAGVEQKQEIKKIVAYQNAMSIATPSDANVTREVHDVILKETGVDVQVIVPPKGAETDKLNMMLASNEQLDVFFGAWPEFSGKGAIQPINTLLETYGKDARAAWDAVNPLCFKAMTDKEGKVWGIPRVGPTYGYPVWMRTDWLKKLDLKAPETMDELEAILKAFKEKDPAGNESTLPAIATLAGINNCLAGAYLENGYSYWLDPKDNKLKIPELHPGYRELIRKMADWYEKGYFYKETFSANAQRLTELYQQGKVGATIQWYSMISLNYENMKKSVPDAEYAILEKGIKGPKGVGETAGKATQTALLIPKNSKNAEAVMQFVNWQYANHENYVSVFYGIKGKQWNYAADENVEITGGPSGRIYFADYNFSPGTPNEMKLKSSTFQSKTLRTIVFPKTDRAKNSFDSGIFFDDKAIKTNVPTLGDIDRLKNEEVIKLILGAVPMSEYDNFLVKLEKAGVDKLSDELTAQYKNLK